MAINPDATDKVVTQYLARYAEHTAGTGANVGDVFDHVLVIPAYGEDQMLDRALDSVPIIERQNILVVVVINEREGSPQPVIDSNQQTVRRLQSRYAELRHLSDNARLYRAAFGALALVQVCLPGDQGVGLARKFGADFALGAWAAGCVRSPWIHCTDADVQLPADYFASSQVRACVGLHRFRHEAVGADPHHHAQIYDLWLRMHVLGLHWAGSPYAFHTIGSTISINARSYAAVRGFPRRNAAEDFYLLNKLAKLQPPASDGGASQAVVRLHSAPVRIAARVSDRVPFGTGRAMGVAQRDGVAALPRFYHGDVYRCLKVLLDALNQSAASNDFDCETIRSALLEQGLPWAPVEAAMDALGLEAAVNKMLGASSRSGQRRRAVHGWFDAWRTMKFSHHLRDNGIASVTAQRALHDCGFLLAQDALMVADDVTVVRKARDTFR